MPTRKTIAVPQKCKPASSSSRFSFVLNYPEGEVADCRSILPFGKFSSRVEFRRLRVYDMSIQARKGKVMNLSKQVNLALVVVLCAIIGVMANSSRGSSASEPQDVSSLDRRISLLEQRFYSIESNISRLQQYVAAQRPAVSQPGVSDRELSLLREEIQRLTLRTNEVECGLSKLDERTTPAARRNPAAKSNDPCRLNPETPVRLSTRP
jgi:hypothetical protein